MWSKSHMILWFADPYRKPPPALFLCQRLCTKRCFPFFTWHHASTWLNCHLTLPMVKSLIISHHPVSVADVEIYRFCIYHVTSHDHVITGSCKVLRGSPLSKATTLPSLIDWPSLLDIKFFLLYRTFSLRQ